jgi:L-cysteine/cystine lyase
MDIQKLRDEIPVLQNLTYMNTGWSGPPPRCAAEAMQARAALEAEQGPTTPGVYESGRDIQEEARRAAARLLGADVDETLVTRNTTEGLNIVLSGLDWKEDDEIVTCNLEHSSVLAPSRHLAHRYGVKVRVLDIDPHDSHDAIVSKFEAAMNDRTRLIFVSHIEYSTGLRMPAVELCRVAHAHGAQIMLDGAQTGGHIALDVHRDGFDYYSIPGQKWALGYEGVGALYIRRELIERVHPAHTGGRGVSQLGETDEPDSYRINSSIMEKFLGGSGSVPLQAAFVEAAKFIESVGVAEIEARNVSLAARFKAQLAEISAVSVLSPMNDAQSAGLVSFAVAGQSADSVVARLWQTRRIVVRQVHYPESVRASLHFFNTEEEVDMLARAVAEPA